jgi:hypothetical protein
MVHETRIIPIQGRGAARPHLPESVRAYYGDSVGHWEGDTFVVEATNYKMPEGGPWIQGTLPYRGSTANLKTIERFRRTSPTKVEHTTTFVDPGTWAREWSISIPWTEDDTQGIFEYACHEGNYGIRNILSGARDEQKRGVTPSNGPALPDAPQE